MNGSQVPASLLRTFQQTLSNGLAVGQVPCFSTAVRRSAINYTSARRFSISPPICSTAKSAREKKEFYAEQARKLGEKGMEIQGEKASNEESHTKPIRTEVDEPIDEFEKKQAQKPWHRAGIETPPVDQHASDLNKGKLLTTPSRLLKLILPLSNLHKNASDHHDIEPLALLVHPQQPLSYLERLIQSEIPTITDAKGNEKIPAVWFKAEDSASEDEVQEKAAQPDEIEEEDIEAEKGGEAAQDRGVDQDLVRTKKVDDKKAFKSDLDDIDVERSLRGGPGEGGIETYSGLGRESPNKVERPFVRWSSSTEIGDFIRDAARGREFAVEIQGAPREIRVGVPSFADRTHYLRVRLRKASKQLDGMARIKQECDHLAHRSAQRLAMGGFGLLVGWWGSIYYFTFMTDYGWDTMEPITYLAGLSTIMLGYLYFLWHNREVSYRSALHMTVSARQDQLYVAKGFDLDKWESLIEEANSLRKEIKTIANEYDVDWNEKKDETSELVHKALKKERRKREAKKDDDDDDELEKKDE